MQDKPLGHHNCLKGKTFVITGTLDSLYRGEAEDYIKRHSGRVTGSVSGKTDFLLVGENSGNSKVNQVKHHSMVGGPLDGKSIVAAYLFVILKPVWRGSDQHAGSRRRCLCCMTARLVLIGSTLHACHAACICRARE